MISSDMTETPTKPPDHNRTGIDFHRPMPRPKVNGIVIDFHTHLLAARHGKIWFDTAKHFGIEAFVTMCPLEEAAGLARDWPGRVHFIVVPNWRDPASNWIDDWLRRLEAFYNLGSRIVKFHCAPS